MNVPRMANGARTGAQGTRYGRSDEWARKACAKYRAQTVQATTAVQLAPELAYVPPPDGYPAPVPLPTIPTDAIKLPTTPAKAPTTKLDVIGEVGSVAETFPGSQLANTVNSQPGERETPELCRYRGSGSGTGAGKGHRSGSSGGEPGMVGGSGSTQGRWLWRFPFTRLGVDSVGELGTRKRFGH